MRPRSALALLVLALVAWGVWFFWLRTAPDTEERRQQGRLLLPGFETGAVEGITIERPSGTIRLVKSADEWRLERPLEDEAEQATVDAVLDRLAEAEVIARIGPDQIAGGDEATGLSSGAISVAFEAGGASRSVVIGSVEAPGGRRYARVDGSAELALVDGAVAGSLTRPVNDFRRRDLFATGAAEVHRWRVAGAGRPDIVFERRQGKLWWLAAPLEDAADNAAVSGLLSRLLTLRADGFVESGRPDAELGLAPPQLAVEFFDREGGRLGVLRIGGEAPEGAGRRYADTDGRDARFEVYAGELLASLTPDPSRFRSKLVLDFSLRDIAEVEIARGDASVTLRRALEDGSVVGPWAAESPADFPLDADKLEEFLLRMSRLEAIRLADSVTETDAALTEPTARLTITGADPDHLPRTVLEIGGAAAPGQVFARTSGRSTIIAIDEATARNIDPASVRR